MLLGSGYSIYNNSALLPLAKCHNLKASCNKHFRAHLIKSPTLCTIVIIYGVINPTQFVVPQSLMAHTINRSRDILIYLCPYSPLQLISHCNSSLNLFLSIQICLVFNYTSCFPCFLYQLRGNGSFTLV
jgi:hypothetical protein